MAPSTEDNPTEHHPTPADPLTDTSRWTSMPKPMTMDEWRDHMRECLRHNWI